MNPKPRYVEAIQGKCFDLLQAACLKEPLWEVEARLGFRVMFLGACILWDLLHFSVRRPCRSFGVNSK